jgi:hypothetical protein
MEDAGDGLGRTKEEDRTPQMKTSEAGAKHRNPTAQREQQRMPPLMRASQPMLNLHRPKGPPWQRSLCHRGETTYAMG